MTIATTANTLSWKDIRMLLHLIEQGEEAITENRNEYETEESREERGSSKKKAETYQNGTTWYV